MILCPNVTHIGEHYGMCLHEIGLFLSHEFQVLSCQQVSFSRYVYLVVFPHHGFPSHRNTGHGKMLSRTFLARDWVEEFGFFHLP